MSRLQFYINELLDNGILERNEYTNHESYRCRCGSVRLRRSSLRSHMETRLHMRWVEEGDNEEDIPVLENVDIPLVVYQDIEIEFDSDATISDTDDNIEIIKKTCDICYEESDNFRCCKKCNNGICLECHDSIRQTNPKCPMCREPIPNAHEPRIIVRQIIVIN